MSLLEGKKVIIIGECLKGTPAEIIYASTECFV